MTENETSFPLDVLLKDSVKSLDTEMSMGEMRIRPSAQVSQYRTSEHAL